MNNTQNQKIAQVTDKTLIAGVDIGSENHYARAILARGFEVSRKPFPFTNTEDGFESFVSWIYNLAAAPKLTKIMYIQTMRPRIDTIARCTPAPDSGVQLFREGVHRVTAGGSKTLESLVL